MNSRAVTGVDIYNKLLKSKKVIFISISLSLVIGLIIDIAIGPAWLNLNQLIEAFSKGPNGKGISSAIVWSVRLPMTLSCIFVGASLGMAGTQMQTILGNPLASPYTLGISAAAGFGAAMSYLTGFPIQGMSWLSVPLSAFIMSVTACLSMFILGKIRGMDPKSLVLFGIVINFFFTALQSLIQFSSTPEVAQEIVFWMFGSLLKSSWTGVVVTGVIFLLSSTLLSRYVWMMTSLSAGEERAKSLGVNTDKLRLHIFIISAVLTAGAVAFVGTIGFIGLVAPHFARLLVGEDQRFLSPLSSIFGALLMIVASILAKVVVPGIIVPIGIVTSLVGVPFLLYLLLRRSK